MAFKPQPLTQLPNARKNPSVDLLCRRFGFSSSEAEEVLGFLNNNANYVKALASSSLYIKGYGFGKKEVILMCKYFGEHTSDLANWESVAELKTYMPTLEHSVLAYRSGLTIDHVKDNSEAFTLEQLKTMVKLKSL